MYFINRNLSQKLNLTGKINAHKVKIFKIHCYEFHFQFFRERERANMLVTNTMFKRVQYTAIFIEKLSDQL